MMLLAVLLLHPVLDEPSAIRLAAADVGPHEVAWSVDGVEVARTSDREAVLVHLGAGAHEVKAASDAPGPWQAMARRDAAADGAAYVPAWTARHDPARSDTARPGGDGVPALPLALAAAAAVLLVWPTRGQPRMRRRETPAPSEDGTKGP